MKSEEFTEQLDEGLLSKIGSRIKKAFTMDDAEYILGRITDAILTVQHNLMTNYYQQSMHWMNLENWAQETKNEDIINLVEDLHLIFNHWPKQPDITLVRETLKSLQLLQTKAEQYFKNNTAQSTTNDGEQLDENLRKWFKEKWVRFGPDGKIRGACARGDDSEGKPKCLPQKKAQNLGKKGRKYAASKKRREDPNPERTGKAKNVATKKKTNEGVPFDECPKCRGPIVHESMMNEKQDACYHKVKSRYKVWPSAYASGALVQCRKKGASNWGTGGKKDESSIMKGIVDEAGSAAQQAAIAISKKERGEKPKNEASGTPGGLERYRTPAMVDLAMQQNLYKKDLEAVKKAQQVDKPKPEYRQRGPVPSGEEQTLHIASTTIPSALVKDWIENRSVSTIVDFMSNRLANRQSTTMIDELKVDPKFVNAVSKFFDIAGKSLEFRIKAKAANTTVNDSKFRVEAEDLRLSAFEAARRMTDILLDYMKKYGVDKTGRRVPPGFNYNLEEAKAKPYVKPFIENGKQVGWKSSDGYHVKYWRLADSAKAKAYQHAKISPDEVQEDYASQFSAEKTPTVNPHAGIKDNQFRGAIGEGISTALNEMPDTSGPVGVQPGGWRTYKPKPAGEIEEDTAYAGGMGQGGNAGQSYRKFKPKSAGTFKEDELDEACWKGYHKEGNKKMFGKTYPNCVKNTNEEEQLDEKCWDTHKQVGMKNKGGRQVPNCVPKESAIMKGILGRD